MEKHVLKGRFFLAIDEDGKVDEAGQVIGVVGHDYVLAKFWHSEGGSTWSEQRLIGTKTMLAWSFFDSITEWQSEYNAHELRHSDGRILTKYVVQP
jgi:hypothetical protein